MSSKFALKLLLVAAALTSAPCIAREYFLNARVPQAEWDLYLGADWFALNDGTKSSAFVVEPGLVTKNDFSFALRAEGHHATGGDFSAVEFGDLTISAGKGWRVEDSALIAFAFIEGGYTEPANNPNCQRNRVLRDR